MSMKTEELPYGRYVIRSAFVKGRWQARAFRNKEIASDTFSGASREEAINLVKDYLDRKKREEVASRDEDGVPSSDAFLRAFQILWPLPSHQLAMLTAHYEAPERILTATQLAAAAGWDDYSAANLHYGKLGFELANELEWSPPTGLDGNPTWTMTLAGGVLDSNEYTSEEHLNRLCDAIGGSGHFEWKMRPQVAAALKILFEKP